MSKVLIALDYDPAARKVAETGYALAKKMEAEVSIIHVISVSNSEYYFSIDYSPIMGYNGFRETDPWQMNSPDNLTHAAMKYLEKVRQHLGDDNIQITVENGAVADTVIKYAKKIDADVIVMGTHGRRLLDELLMGSATEKALRHSDIPLFIVPTRSEK